MRLQAIIDAGAVCVWSGAQKRTLIPLCRATEQGSGGGAVLPSPPEEDTQPSRLVASGHGGKPFNDMAGARRAKWAK